MNTLLLMLLAMGLVVVILLLVSLTRVQRRLLGEMNALRSYFQSMETESNVPSTQADQFVTRVRQIIELARVALKAKPVVSLDMIIRAIDRQAAAEAIAMYQDITASLSVDKVDEEFPTAEIRQLAAVCLLSLGKPDRALPLLKQLTKDQPADEEALFLMGLAYNDIARFEKAIECFRQLAEVSENNDALYLLWGVNLARLYDETTKVETLRQAVEKFEQAAKINEANDSAWYNWGLALGRLAELEKDTDLYRQSLQKLERAAAISVTSDRTQFALAEVYAALGQPDRAIQALSKSINLNPKNAGRAVRSARFSVLQNDERFVALFDK